MADFSGSPVAQSGDCMDIRGPFRVLAEADARNEPQNSGRYLQVDRHQIEIDMVHALFSEDDGQPC